MDTLLYYIILCFNDVRLLDHVSLCLILYVSYYDTSHAVDKKKKQNKKNDMVIITLVIVTCIVIPVESILLKYPYIFPMKLYGVVENSCFIKTIIKTAKTSGFYRNV